MCIRDRDSIPADQTSVALILDLAFEQVVLNTESEEAKAEKEAGLRRERVRQMMDAAEMSVNTAATAKQSEGQLLTLLRYGDELGRSDEVQEVEVRETMETANSRIRSLSQLPGPEYASAFPSKRMTEHERGARRTELYQRVATTQLSTVAIERALMLGQFEKMLNLPEKLRDFTVTECFGPDTLSQVVASARMLDGTHVTTGYYPDHNACLLASSLTTSESHLDFKELSAQLPLRSRCAEWMIACKHGESKGVQSLVDFSLAEMGPEAFISRSTVEPALRRIDKMLSPLDGTLLVTEGGNGDCTLLSENLICGLRQQGSAEDRAVDSSFFSSFNDGGRLCVTVSEAECTLQFTSSEGLSVISSSLGRITQIKHAKAGPNQRVVLADGTVIVVLDDERRKILFPNGNSSERTSSGDWICTNQLGARTCTDQAGQERYMACLLYTSPSPRDS
eukprot:TRINITY_DN7610_c0_g1_i1.p1 TRINITY_DN7610_c0_g1~~TRINITY_DN7610_c0_g1_i1.p1  ORF type:complete len:451 (-),score=117.67 TRINITY_DN7610_c0_g1_i1:85-1437(-)